MTITMATLTETAYYSRNIIKWSVIALIGFTILRILFGAALDALKKAFPTPPLRPNNLFGKLPKIEFPQTASPSGQLTFTLQTISGKVPEASEAARVYFMPKNRINLLSLSKAQKFVGKLGFTETPKQLDETRYRWMDLKNPLRSIDVDIVSEHFNLQYAFIHDLALFNERSLPSSTQAVIEGYTFLQSLGLANIDLNTNLAKVTYLKLVGDQLETTSSQSQANSVKVHFFRSTYDGLPVVNDSPNEANVAITLSSNKQTDKRILTASYAYWPLDTQTIGAYKLKTSQQAWNELVNGNAYLASLPKQPVTQIAITNIYLAYYDSKKPQLFLQPVFVFEGENNFVGYIPAIDLQWIQ